MFLLAVCLGALCSPAVLKVNVKFLSMYHVSDVFQTVAV
jgi:hypothetical protein